MPAHPKPTPKAKKPGAMRTKPKADLVNAAEVAKTAAAAPKAAKPKAAPKKAGMAERGPIPAKRAPKATAAKPAAPAGGSKSEMLLGMLRKPGGASSKEMEAATGWAPHSVRGFLGTLRKKGVVVTAKKFAKGEPTVYSIEAAAAADDPVGDIV